MGRDSAPVTLRRAHTSKCDQTAQADLNTERSWPNLT